VPAVRDVASDPRAALRPLDREEIDRRLRAPLDALLASRGGGAARRPVAISAADLVRLAAPMTSRN
jgi:hypothetical protein